MLAKVYRGLRFFRTGGMWKGGRKKKQQTSGDIGRKEERWEIHRGKGRRGTVGQLEGYKGCMRVHDRWYWAHREWARQKLNPGKFSPASCLWQDMMLFAVEISVCQVASQQCEFISSIFHITNPRAWLWCSFPNRPCTPDKSLHGNPMLTFCWSL